MTRSLWKGPFVNFSFFQKLKTYSRNSYILPQFVGKKVEIHNGKIFVLIQITEDMVGHKFGEFSLTRKQTIHKQKK